MKDATLRLSDTAVVLRKMRIRKGFSRKQAGVIFHLSHKTIEKLENGRGLVDEQRLISFADGYGFGIDDLYKIRTGQYDEDITRKLEEKKEKDPKRRDRRFCKTIITKECRVLRQLREKKGISQYKLSEICGFDRRRIGFYENGRKNLTPELIESIITKMGYTMCDFQKQMEVDEMPYEVTDQCKKMMNELDLKTLKAVRSFLQNFTEIPEATT